MDHPMIGAEHFQAARRSAYVPPVSVGGAAVKDRLDRHLAVLVPEGADPARIAVGRGLPTGEPARLGVAQTAQLLREITPRPSAPTRRRISLRAPLRSFKRWIGF
ncbi:MAG: hypothetical protein ACRDVE_17145 [Actinocrinis sp.]